ncbi:hypothetical protein [Microbulbifer marinus]|uniref:Lipoprotein n=1 Tax=Microbulbifer marinus TaxID=658218 RepID=A0A1H3XHL1_9GAMM|nr:hypothetical protein [Microbulbifer marinus]SDZ98915.1 hypothetical protein SAMN05216562_1558 [Microbulbifer marinus]
MKLADLMCLIAPLVLLTACGSQPAHGDPRPALLAEPGPEVRAELQQLVSEAMHGVPVTLAADALTKESVLVVERKPQQPRLSGREFGQPVKFQLMLDEEACWLVRLSDGERWALRKATCRPEVSES